MLWISRMKAPGTEAVGFRRCSLGGKSARGNYVFSKL